MAFLEPPTRQQLDILCGGDQRLLRSFSSLFEFVQATERQQLVTAKNASGGQINKATPVMYDGIDNVGSEASYRMTFTKADASSGARSNYLGILRESTIDGQFGVIVNFGEITGIDTSGPDSETWNDGDVLYLNTGTTGTLTNIRPNNGFILPTARVLRASTTSGSILVDNNFAEGDS